MSYTSFDFPHTHFYDDDLRELIKKVFDMSVEVKNFVSVNAIKYANPIQWNITSQYEKNTIVIDPLTGTAYISVAAVPSGVALTREDFWTVVFDLGQFVVRASKNFSERYEQETTLTATFATSEGQWLVWGDTLYVANVNITPGDSYVVGGNIRHITMEEMYNAVMSIIDNEVQARQDGDTALQDAIDAIESNIGNLEDLNTEDKSDIVAAINEVNSTGGGALEKIGNLDDLNTTDKSNVVAAINEVVGNVEDLEALVAGTYTSPYTLSGQQFITDFDTDVISDLTSGVYLYKVIADNHTYSALIVNQDSTHKSVFVTSFSNVATTGIAGLWNYNPQSAAWNYNVYPTTADIPNNDLLSQYYSNKKVLILGDSLSSPGKVWVNKFTEFVESLGGTVTNWAVNAYTAADMYNKLNTETAQNFDKFIMWIGQNDYNQHVMPGNTGATFASDTFGYSVENSLQLLISKFGNPEGALVGIHWSIRQGYTGKKLGRREWSRISYFCAKKYGHTFIDMNKAPFIGWGQDPDVWTVPGDNVHFNDTYQENYLWQFLAKASAEKNDGLVGIDTEYNINNAPNMFTPATGVTDYRHFLDVEDTGYAHLYMVLQTTAQLTPSSGVILLGTWNFEIFSNYETSITAIDSTNKKVYDGILIHGNNGQLRLYTSDTIPSGATLQLRAPHLKTNQLTFYTPTEL